MPKSECKPQAWTRGVVPAIRCLGIELTGFEHFFLWVLVLRGVGEHVEVILKISYPFLTQRERDLDDDTY